MSATKFYRDVYQRKHNVSTHRAIFEEYDDSHPFMGADTLVICELDDRWDYNVPALADPESGIDAQGHPYPQKLIVTSPNMSYVPDITKATMNVQVHLDGCFGVDDFMVAPQWYFEGTYYLPYIRRRPDDLEKDEYGPIWYDLKRRDYVLEKGGLFSGLGRIREDLVETFFFLRRALVAKIKELDSDSRFSGTDCAELQYAKQAIIFASVILRCTPQTWELTLLTVTGFQCHFLEALACYEYLTIYKYKDIEEDNSHVIANPSLMGTFTASLEMAELMYCRGVPVWYICVPMDVPLSTTIINSVNATLLGYPLAFLPNSQKVYIGHASSIQNRACQALKVGSIRLRHAAYTMLPGNFNAEFIADKTSLKPVYCSPITDNSPGSSTSYLLLSGQPGSASSSTSSARLAIASLSSSSATRTATTLSCSSFVSSAPGPTGSSSSSSGTTFHVPSSMNATSSLMQVRSSSASSSGGGQPPAHVSLYAAPQFGYVANQKEVNTSKFMPLPLSVGLILNEGWAHSLHSVQINGGQVINHDRLEMFRGYPFLDSYVLAKAATPRLKLYIMGWLAIRPAWIACLLDVSRDLPVFPNPQEWKDFLGIDVARVLGLSDQQKESRQIVQKRQKRGVSIKDSCGLDWTGFKGPVDIMWRNNVMCVATRDTLDNLACSPLLLTEISWDLMEHNFRLELLALDRCVFPRGRMSDANGALCDGLMLACIPSESVISLHYPARDEGLGARDWEDRMEYVEAFHILLSDWTGPQAEQLKSLRAIERLEGSRFHAVQEDVMRVEQIAIPFYCQTFFAFFGRAPCVPYRRPM